MADTYEAFYNGKPLNPNRGLPTMTYAQAEDCGLTESERLWCRTDGDDTPVTADDIPYDSNNSVKDKIDDMNTVKTGNLEQGTEYSTYVYTLYKAQAEEKNGIVNVNVVFELNTVTASSGWKEIFRLPSNITKPTSVQTINVIMGDNKYNQFRIGTDGSVSLNGGIATTRTISYVGNITYLV